MRVVLGVLCFLSGVSQLLLNFGWIPRRSRCSVEHEFSPPTLAVFMVVVMVAVPPGSQDAGGFRAHSPAIQAFPAFHVTTVGVSLSWTGPSVSRSTWLVLGVLWYPGGVIAVVTVHASSGMSDGYGSMMAGLWVPTSTCSPWRAWQVYGSQDVRGVCTLCTFEPARSSQFGGEIAGGADFEWIPRGALLSCIPSTKSFG